MSFFQSMFINEVTLFLFERMKTFQAFFCMHMVILPSSGQYMPMSDWNDRSLSYLKTNKKETHSFCFSFKEKLILSYLRLKVHIHNFNGQTTQQTTVVPILICLFKTGGSQKKKKERSVVRLKELGCVEGLSGILSKFLSFLPHCQHQALSVTGFKVQVQDAHQICSQTFTATMSDLLGLSSSSRLEVIRKASVQIFGSS